MRSAGAAEEGVLAGGHEAALDRAVLLCEAFAELDELEARIERVEVRDRVCLAVDFDNDFLALPSNQVGQVILYLLNGDLRLQISLPI